MQSLHTTHFHLNKTEATFLVCTRYITFIRCVTFGIPKILNIFLSFLRRFRFKDYPYSYLKTLQPFYFTFPYDNNNYRKIIQANCFIGMRTEIYLKCNIFLCYLKTLLLILLIILHRLFL